MSEDASDTRRGQPYKASGGPVPQVDAHADQQRARNFHITPLQRLIRLKDVGPTAEGARVPGKPGRPRVHADLNAGRRAANRRNAERDAASGRTQRSVTLPREVWLTLRATRATGETSDAQMLVRWITATRALS